jgi:hypothetical protein
MCPLVRSNLQATKGTGQAMEPGKFGLFSRAGAVILGLLAASAFAPAPAAAAVSAEVQQACTPDVMRLCNQFVPDVAKITACMNHNRANVSKTCRDAIHPPRVKRKTHYGSYR